MFTNILSIGVTEVIVTQVSFYLDLMSRLTRSGIFHDPFFYLLVTTFNRLSNVEIENLDKCVKYCMFVHLYTNQGCLIRSKIMFFVFVGLL